MGMGEGEWTLVTPRGRRQRQRRTISSPNSTPNSTGSGARMSPSHLNVPQPRRSRSRSRSRSKSSVASQPCSPFRTTFHSAALWSDALTTGNEECVHLCLSQGADVNSALPLQSKNIAQAEATYVSPLEIAARQGRNDVVDTLLRHGADRRWYAAALRAVEMEERISLGSAKRAGARRRVGNLRVVGGLIRLWAFSYEKDGVTFASGRELVRCSQTTILPDVVGCRWEVPDVISVAQAKEDGKSVRSALGRLVVLTGLGGEYEATTCEEYLKREWRDVGLEILEWIVSSLDIERGVTTTTKHPSTKYVRSLTTTSSSVELVCQRSLTLKKKYAVIDALTWICEAVRLPTQKDAGFRASSSTSSCRLVRSTASGEQSISGEGQGSSRYPPGELALKLDFELEPLAPLPTPDGQCWLSLFRRCVVSARPAKGRPSGFGKGLEASFGRLVELSATELRVPIEEGSVFVGYQTVLVPYGFKRSSENESYLQFHLESSRKSGQINPFNPRNPRTKPILRNDEYDITPYTRCFLGWCPRGQINLGTRALEQNPVYSHTEAQQRTLHMRGLTVGAQATSGGPVQAGLMGQVTGEYVSNLLRFTPHVSYTKMLSDTSKQVAVIIDNATQRSWMVPKLSLLLYMAHCWLRAGTPGLVHPGSVPYIDPHHDGNQVAECLATHGDNLVCGTANSNDGVTLRTLLLDLNVNLIESRRLTEPARDASVFQDGYIYAFELLDLVYEPGKGASMRKVPVGSSGWLRICHNADAVVVCGNLGEAITPAPTVGMGLPLCNVLPSDRHYLAATVSCLKLITETSWDGKSARMCLEVRKNPFAECAQDERGRKTCWEKKDMFQGFVKAPKVGKKRRGDPGSGQLKDLPHTGVLVFGTRMTGKSA